MAFQRARLDRQRRVPCPAGRGSALAVAALVLLGACALGEASDAPSRESTTDPPATALASSIPEDPREPVGPLPASEGSPDPISPPPVEPSVLLADSQLQAAQGLFGPQVGVAVAPLDGSAPVGFGDGRTAYAWSTGKVLVVARTILDVGGPDALSGEQRRLIEAALTASDNDAAARLHSDLVARHGSVEAAAAAMQELLRRGGDPVTVVSTVGRGSFTTYGQTDWSPAEQARFMAALARGCVLDSYSTDYLLDALSRTTQWQRFGLGTSGAQVFKGGWGPDPDGAYLVRQMGLQTAPDGNTYAVAITARPDSGSFEAGQALLGEAAQWVAANVQSAPMADRCS